MNSLNDTVPLNADPALHLPGSANSGNSQNEWLGDQKYEYSRVNHGLSLTLFTALISIFSLTFCEFAVKFADISERFSG